MISVQSFYGVPEMIDGEAILLRVIQAAINAVRVG